ncbi:MAG: hypothetical protein ABSH51_17865 [Solirubrobacteraceae bacterium]
MHVLHDQQHRPHVGEASEDPVHGLEQQLAPSGQRLARADHRPQ